MICGKRVEANYCIGIAYTADSLDCIANKSANIVVIIEAEHAEDVKIARG
tara:strand:+ start:353 stop:502 length:150 start_codon:yes stop_codon:yes gene_type:complete